MERWYPDMHRHSWDGCTECYRMWKDRQVKVCCRCREEVANLEALVICARCSDKYAHSNCVWLPVADQVSEHQHWICAQCERYQKESNERVEEENNRKKREEEEEKRRAEELLLRRPKAKVTLSNRQIRYFQICDHFYKVEIRFPEHTTEQVLGTLVTVPTVVPLTLVKSEDIMDSSVDFKDIVIFVFSPCDSRGDSVGRFYRLVERLFANSNGFIGRVGNLELRLLPSKQLHNIQQEKITEEPYLWGYVKEIDIPNQEEEAPASHSRTAGLSFKEVDFFKLQNGGDIHGVACDGVEGEPVNLTEPVAEAIAAGFADWLSHKKNSAGSKLLTVSIGHDSRLSAQKLLDAASRGLISAGTRVIHYGLASTPAMFNSTLTQNEVNRCPVDGSIMITAGHLAYNRNGFKFFTSEGELSEADIKDVLQLASSKDVNAYVSKVDYMSIYASDLVTAIRKAAGNKEKPLEGLHIVVDAGNGAGGFFVTQALEPLGAVTTGSQFLEPDGLFPNHMPNPEDQTAMRAIVKAVLDNKADLGILFDADVDRSAAVDSTGREFNGDRLIALVAAITLEEHPGTTVVTDSLTSDGLTAFIENRLGGKHHRFKTGYKNITDEAIRLNSIGEETHLAIDTSGHGALKENRWLDDGAYLMVKVLSKLASARSQDQSVGSEILVNAIDGLDEAIK